MSVRAFWRALDQDRSLIEEIPASRFDWRAVYDPAGTDPLKSHTKWGGFIPVIEDFDCALFGIPAAEADRMDPRQRLLLMAVYNALEDAGYAPSCLKQTPTGVFIAAEDNEYQRNLLDAGVEVPEPFSHAASMLANRISYFFDFRGPSEVVNTMCSGAAVALHRAVMALRAGELEQAVVGAANLILRSDLDIGLSALQQLSRSKSVKSFGAEASGYLRAEGVAAIVLKPLARAEADGDAIYAVIRNSAVNFNGQGGTSIAAPNVASHAELIEKCYADAGVDPSAIGYIEAQGMGNQVADIAEWDACNRALKALAAKRGLSLTPGHCRISSLKPMIGHMHAASALGALFKIIRSFQTDRIHGILDFATANPFLDRDHQPCRLAVQTEAWTGNGAPRLAGLHSYGSGGNNAHVLIEEYRTRGTLAPPALEAVPVSAENAVVQRRLVEQLLEALDEHPDHSLASVAHTLQRGRDPMRCRVVFVAESIASLKQQMGAYLRAELASGVYAGATREDSETGESDLHRLARRWASGASIDWTRRFAQRVHLPSYPFDLRRCWIDPPGQPKDRPSIFDLERVDDGGTRYRLRLNGTEFFLADHRLAERKTFPGVAYLEAARQAAEECFELRIGSLSDVIWQTPIHVDDEPADAYIELDREDGGVRYTVTTTARNGEAGRITHGEGWLWSGPAPTSERSDIAAARRRCRRELDSESLYARLGRSGLRYGSAFRALHHCRIGDREVIAKVALPDGLSVQREVVLHPSLLDAALQASTLLLFEWDGAELESGGAPVPFSLAEARIHRRPPRELVVWSRIASAPDARVTLIDSDLCDEQGDVCVSLRGFHARKTPALAMGRLELEQATWVEKELPDKVDELTTKRVSMRLSAWIDIPGAELLDVGALDPAQALQAVVGELVDKLRDGVADDVDHQYLFDLWCDETVHPSTREGLVSFIKSIPKEYGHIRGKVIESRRCDRFLAVMKELATPEVHVRYEDGKRYIRTPVAIHALPSPDADLLGARGKTYWIVGGGALGVSLAAWLIENLDAHVIVSSRSGRTSGEPRMRWLPLDVSDSRQVERCAALLRDEGVDIEGVFFTAGAVTAKATVEKTRMDIARVMASKCGGAQNVLAQCHRLSCRFVALFSSQSYQGEYQNADYAAANGFLNGLGGAALRNRRGESVSIVSVNWPQWQAGRMRPSPALVELMQRAHGTVPLPNALGWKILREIVCSGLPQVAVQYRVAMEKAPHASPAVRPLSNERAAQAGGIVRGVIADVLKVVPATLDMNAAFSALGIDSVAAVGISVMLRKRHGIGVPPAALFEFATPAQLQQHIAGLRAEAALPSTSGSHLPPSSRSTPEIRDQAGESRARAARTDDGDSSNRNINGTEPIAIVGMYARFPQADGVDAFWRNIADGKDCIGEAPLSRWNWRALASDGDRSCARWGGFIDGVDEFDPLFFAISPREAEMMDPQQRLLLMAVWSALENGGIVPDEFAKRTTGVFVAAGPGEYSSVVAIPDHHPLRATAEAASIAPNRISHVFNFNGPSEYCDTACSSGLVALHRAVRAVRGGECEQAIVAAVNLLLSPATFARFHAMEYLARDGRCRPFQADADGFVRSEGVGALVLKPLHAARADGDIVHAVIRGTGAHHGGRGFSLTAPSMSGMRRAMLDAYRDAAVDPRTVSYVEAHGVSSPISDAVEVSALKAGFRELEAQSAAAIPHPPAVRYLGTLKPCIGHGEFVSGLAAVIKVASALRHRIVPGLPRFTRLHEDIVLEDGGLRIAQQSEAWAQLTDHRGVSIPRRASINSFGFGGVSAHAVLEEYPPVVTDEPSERPHPAQIVVLSAKNADRLKALAARLLSHVESVADLSLGDCAYTLQMGRQAFNTRVALVVHSRDELIEGLTRYVSDASPNELLECAVYAGDTRQEGAVVAQLLSGAAGDAALNSFMAENALSSIAQFWALGGAVPWQRLQHGKRRRRIPLPTYAFAAERHWWSAVASEPERPIAEAHADHDSDRPDRVQDRIREFLAQALHILPSEIGARTLLPDTGADSIVLVKLIRALNEWYGLDLSGRELLPFQTIAAIAAYVADRRQGAAERELSNAESVPDALDLFKRGLMSLEDIAALIEEATYDSA